MKLTTIAAAVVLTALFSTSAMATGCKTNVIDNGYNTVDVYGNVTRDVFSGFANNNTSDFNPAGVARGACADGTAPAGHMRPGGFCEYTTNLATLATPSSTALYEEVTTWEVTGTEDVKNPDTYTHQFLDAKKTAVQSAIDSAIATKEANKNKKPKDWVVIVKYSPVWKDKQHDGKCS